MGETEYSEALKLGKKEYRARIAKGQFPYLPVLDETAIVGLFRQKAIHI